MYTYLNYYDAVALRTAANARITNLQRLVLIRVATGDETSFHQK